MRADLNVRTQARKQLFKPSRPQEFTIIYITMSTTQFAPLNGPSPSTKR